MTAVIDRIEGDIAVVIIENSKEKINIPVSVLPKGYKEGSRLKFNIALDLRIEHKQRNRISHLLKKMTGRDIL